MKIAGLAVVMAGWLLAMAGLFITGSNAGRAIFATAGIVISLIGSLGILNSAHLATVIWKQ